MFAPVPKYISALVAVASSASTSSEISRIRLPDVGVTKVALVMLLMLIRSLMTAPAPGTAVATHSWPRPSWDTLPKERCRSQAPSGARVKGNVGVKGFARSPAASRIATVEVFSVPSATAVLLSNPRINSPVAPTRYLLTPPIRGGHRRRIINTAADLDRVPDFRRVGRRLALNVYICYAHYSSRYWTMMRNPVSVSVEVRQERTASTAPTGPPPSGQPSPSEPALPVM